MILYRPIHDDVISKKYLGDKCRNIFYDNIILRIIYEDLTFIFEFD